MGFPTPETVKKTRETISDEDIDTLKAALLKFDPDWPRVIVARNALKSHPSAVSAFLRHHRWDCKLTHDQRDGDFYTITPVRTR